MRIHHGWLGVPITNVGHEKWYVDATSFPKISHSIPERHTHTQTCKKRLFRVVAGVSIYDDTSSQVKSTQPILLMATPLGSIDHRKTIPKHIHTTTETKCQFAEIKRFPFFFRVL